MAINDKLKELLSWYHENGITMLVADEPKNNYGQKKLEQLKPIERSDIMPTSTPKVKAIRASQAQTSRDIAAKCQTLAELQDAMQAFEGCSLKLTATNLVFGDGNPQAPIMVVGEAPGADEDRQGKPFVGLSGQLLDRAFATIGLDRQRLYISNIIPWRPPGNRPPTTEEMTICQPFIERHIELVKPKVLILVGGVSAKTLLNTNEGILRLRGQWQQYQSPGLTSSIKALATLHPAYLLRSPGQKALVWRDLQLLEDELKSLF